MKSQWDFPTDNKLLPSISNPQSSKCSARITDPFPRETEAQVSLSWAALGRAGCDGHPLHQTASHQGPFLTPCHVLFGKDMLHLNNFC